MPTKVTMAHIERAAEMLGITLLPWQREVAQAIVRGDNLAVYPAGRRAGRKTFQQISEQAHAWAESAWILERGYDHD